MRKISRREKRRIERLRRIGFMLVAISVIVIIFFLFNTSFFKLDIIGIAGNDRVSNDEIIASSGLRYGENILKANLDTASKNIEQLPYIKNVEITRTSRNKLTITVEEREEDFAYYSAGKIFICDYEGRILNIVQMTDVTPIIRGYELDGVEIGSNIFDKEELKGLKDILDTARELDELKKYTEIKLQSASEYGLVREGGTSIDFGSATDIKYKFVFIKNIVEKMAEDGMKPQIIKLNSDADPVVVPMKVEE
ncbi:MAG: FtsQ-type POTRA domain-containing protein [Ezakiella sp.]|nr:FtsQ-type POTRA domain-containing protein [Ezakiella sp.]